MDDMFSVLSASVKAAPIENFTSSAVEGSKLVMNDLSILGLFMQADLVVKVVMIMLIMASVCNNF
jgi:hypothetical protein